jgi:fatty acid-binding protein DegV
LRREPPTAVIVMGRWQSAVVVYGLIEVFSELAPFERVAILHTHAPDRAEELRRQVQRLLPEGEVMSLDITPVIGAHIGPGAAGFACVTAKQAEV